MKRQITAGLTAFAMLLSGVPAMMLPEVAGITAHAEDYTTVTEGYLTYRVYSTYAEVSDFDWKCPDAVVTIPNTVNGLPVISIGNGAFKHLKYADAPSSLEEVVLPAGLISIGSSAFMGSTIVTMDIPDSVDSFGSWAFCECENLTSVKLPKYCKELPHCMFSDCPKLDDVIIPSAVETIGYNAFTNTGLTSVTIPGSVKKIDTSFTECTALKTVVIEEGATGIDNAFAGCTALESVKLPSTMCFVQSGALSGAFMNCSSLTDVTIPEGVTYDTAFGASLYNTFEGCTSLKQIQLPESFHVIVSDMFHGCSSLESFEISKGVNRIAYSAFEDCISLKEIVIPANVETVQPEAFMNCAKLEKIVFLNPDCDIYPGGYTICNYTLNNKYYYNGTICGYEGSTAQAYAEKFGYHFELIGTPSPGVTLGDLNADNAVNASDAATILIAAAAAGAEGDYSLTDEQMAAADVNGDGTVNASDAALVLIYAAYVGSAEEPVSFEEFMKNRG
ncbi:MAG: leucine-rich repeat protein [Oscillospiraceae bacterium]|nr:leucine-rich repeat protein [Oscillospiraceae bacterium]